MKVGIVVGSIREGRKGIHVGQWVLDEASKREDATFELIDVKEFDLPLLTSSTLPAAAKRQYDSERGHRRLRCLCLRDTRVQPWRARRIQERGRPARTRMGGQGNWLRVVRVGRGRPGRGAVAPDRRELLDVRRSCSGVAVELHRVRSRWHRCPGSTACRGPQWTAESAHRGRREALTDGSPTLGIPGLARDAQPAPPASDPRGGDAAGQRIRPTLRRCRSRRAAVPSTPLAPTRCPRRCAQAG